MKIKEMLDRRTDLSTFVVHLTRCTESTAAANMVSMLREHRIRAMTAMGAASGSFQPGTPEWNSQRVVSFTESPLEQLHSFFVDFEESRRHRFEPYGLAFTKMQARRIGTDPVWYTDVTWVTPWRVRHIWNLVKQQAANGTFVGSDIAQIAPFVETMGYVRSAPHKEFWWEREWRHLGDVDFSFSGVALGLCPEDRIVWFEAFVQALSGGVPGEQIRFVDPRWGLEQIVGTLAGARASDMSPFTA